MKKINLKFISIIIICFTILCSIGIFSYFSYHKEELKLQQENERLKKEEKSKDYNRQQLTACISQAGINRTNLWNANCPENKPNCSLQMDQIEWIDKRYEQEVNECKMKWNF